MSTAFKPNSTSNTINNRPTSLEFINHIKSNGINGLIELKIKRAITNGGYTNTDWKRKYISKIKKESKLQKYTLKAYQIHYNSGNIHLEYMYNGNTNVYTIYLGLNVIKNSNKITLKDIYYNSYRDITQHSLCTCPAYSKEFYCKHFGAILYGLMDKKIIKDNSIPTYNITPINIENSHTNRVKIKINYVEFDKDTLPFKYGFDPKLFTLKSLQKWFNAPNAINGILYILMSIGLVNTFSHKCKVCTNKTVYDAIKFKWVCACDFEVDVLQNSCFKDIFHINISQLQRWWKFMIYYMECGLKNTLKQVCTLAGVNIKQGTLWSQDIRDIFGIKRQSYRLLGLYNSVIEFDGYYFTNKSNIFKNESNKSSKVPAWFRQLCLGRMVERDYNIHGRHNQYTIIIKSESKHSLSDITNYCLIGSRLYSDGCGLLHSKYFREKYIIKQCNHSKMKFVIKSKEKDNKSDDLIHNNLSEYLWRNMSLLNNIKCGFACNNDGLYIFNSLLWYFDWCNTSTNNTLSHKISTLLDNINEIYPSIIPN